MQARLLEQLSAIPRIVVIWARESREVDGLGRSGRDGNDRDGQHQLVCRVVVAELTIEEDCYEHANDKHDETRSYSGLRDLTSSWGKEGSQVGKKA
jgi:hypothetical protein